MKKSALPGLVILVLFVVISSMALVPPAASSPTGTPTLQATASATLSVTRSRTTTPPVVRTRLGATARALAALSATAASLKLSATLQATPTFAITPTKVKPTPVLPLSQAGNTDRIVIIGIFIVGIIVVPIVLKRREWRTS